MSYLLNKTDGTLLTELIDGRIDNRSTNLTLVGRNYNGFGEAFNENFIKLLENFSNNNAPSIPLEGQVWWDRSTKRLKVYNGNLWKAAGGPFVQDTRPDMVAGDLWIDEDRQQLYAFDGRNLILVGPEYTREQGLSGLQVETMLDSQARSKTVIKLYIGEKLISVISNEDFDPLETNIISGLVTINNPTGRIFKGINVIGRTDQDAEDGQSFRFIGIAESTDTLVTPGTGEFRSADQFLPSDRAGKTSGSLEIQNVEGLRFSISDIEVYNVQRIQDQKFFIENQIKDYDLSLRVRASAAPFNSNIVDAIYIDAARANVGIFKSNPEYRLDVSGDLRVEGNLRVEGDTITVQSTTLQIQDKNIELAVSDGTAAGPDEIADGGGIQLRSTEGDKTIFWFNSTDSWTSNQPFNLSNPTHSYKINNSTKLTSTSLTNIFSAPDLTEIATENGLNFLDVDNINMNENTVFGTGGLVLSSDAGITFTSTNNIILTNPVRISGVGSPSSNLDVANKAYVDAENRLQPIALTLDITGLGSGTDLETNIGIFLNDLYPATSAHDGKIARIHTYTYSGTLVDLGGNVTTITRVAVRNENDDGTVSVVRDVAFQSIPYPPPTRALYTFIVQNGVWVANTVSPYEL